MKILTKFDILLIILIIIVASSFNFILASKKIIPSSDGIVTIYFKNEVYKTLSLGENKIVDIETELGHNTVEIKDFQVNMIDATCKDQYCVKEHSIKYNNESILCLPNQVLVKIESNEQSDLDAIAR